MLSTFMPSEPSERALSAYADAIVAAVFENCRCHHWSPTCALTRAINSRMMCTSIGTKLFLCGETEMTSEAFKVPSAMITENGFVL